MKRHQINKHRVARIEGRKGARGERGKRAKEMNREKGSGRRGWKWSEKEGNREIAKVDRARDESAWMVVDKKDRDRASERKRERGSDQEND